MTDINAFKIEIADGIVPSCPSEGWWLGSGSESDSPSKIGLMLATPSDSHSLGVSGKQARIFIHPEPGLLVIEARRPTTIVTPYIIR